MATAISHNPNAKENGNLFYQEEPFQILVSSSMGFSSVTWESMFGCETEKKITLHLTAPRRTSKM